MEDLDELKDRVERATRALTEREAEEQSRHSQLVALMAALEARSLEAREAREHAEARLAASEAENEELRGLLVGLLDAVETGSRSRFADAIYALEARIAPAQPVPSEAPGPEESGDEPAGLAPAPEAEDEAPSLADSEEDPDDFTARLAAGCAVEDDLAQEAEALRAAAAADARSLLDRIRREVDPSGDPATDLAGDESEAMPGDPAAAESAEAANLQETSASEPSPDGEGPVDHAQADGTQAHDAPAEEPEWRERRQAAS
jgi:hypothetical protein